MNSLLQQKTPRMFIATLSSGSAGIANTSSLPPATPKDNPTFASKTRSFFAY